MFRIKEEKKGKNLFFTVGIILILAIVTTLFVINSRQNSTVMRENDQAGAGNVAEDKKQNEGYNKLKQLFSKNESTMAAIIDGYTRTGILMGDSEIAIYLDPRAKGKGDLKYIGPSEETNAKDEHQCSVATYNLIKGDEELCNTIKTMLINGEIEQFEYDTKTHEVKFSLFADKIPFITETDASGAAFIYSEQPDCLQKGYQQIKGNWYMYILPRSK